VAENVGVGDNAWKQIMFIVLKTINIFWRKCFVTNEHHTLKACFFSQTFKILTVHLWTKLGRPNI